MRCAGVTLALPLSLVVEVVLVVAPAAPLLRAPRYCLGAMDYHGQLAPLIDLGARLGLSRPRTTLELAEGRIVILRARSGLVGYLTDEVLELCEVGGIGTGTGNDEGGWNLAAGGERVGGLGVGAQQQIDALLLVNTAEE